MGLGDAIPTGIATGTSGSLLGAAVVNSIGIGATFTLAAGVYVIYVVGAAVRPQVFDGTAWQNVEAAALPQSVYYSDGINFRFINNGAGAQSFTSQKIG